MESLKYLQYLKYLADLVNLVENIDEIRTKQRRKRSCSVRRINRDRHKNGYYVSVFKKMKEHDCEQFFIHTRMIANRFDYLLELLKTKLRRLSIRKPISPECRLAVTLNYLSQGVSFQYLASSFKLGKETVRKIVLETCEAIWETLAPFYVSEPHAFDLEQISEDFYTLWGMPNCIGSIDGKHIAITRPRNSRALYFNYKKFYSIVLMAACDARYTFTYIDVGAYGAQGDSGTFRASSFGKRVINKELELPHPKYLPGTRDPMTHFFVANAAFPLSLNIMKPYPGHVSQSQQKEIFNKKLSRARTTIENAFGILVNRWRILLQTIQLQPKNAEKVVLTCVALHNFIMINDINKNRYCPSNFVDWIDEDGNVHEGEWRHNVEKNLLGIQPLRVLHRFDGLRATEMRNKLSQYFSEKRKVGTLSQSSGTTPI